MISEHLHKLIELNLIATMSIILILSMRFWFRRYFGARNAYRLWLILPITLAASQLPPRQIVETKHALAAIEQSIIQSTPVTARAYSPPPAIAKAERTTPIKAPAPTLEQIAIWIWLTGVMLSFAILCWRQHNYVTRLGALRRDIINGFTVWYALRNDIEPALVGAIRPKLILPADFHTRYSSDEQHLILAHERAHFLTGDPLINLSVSVALSVCWFNPILHLAATYLRKDQELACDARVIAQHPKKRRLYAETLVKSQTAQMAIPIGCAWPSAQKSALIGRVANLNLRGGHRAYIFGLSAVVLLAGTGAAVAWTAKAERRVTQIKRIPNLVAGIDIQNAAADLTVIAEDRSDMTLTFQENENLQRPRLRIENQRLVIDGGLSLTNASCTEAYNGNGPVNVPTVGSLGKQELLKLTLHIPRNVDLRIDGIVLTQVNGVVDGRIESTSCGKTTIGPSENEINVVLAGYGDMELARNDTHINAAHYGTGDMTLTNGENAMLNIYGIGDIRAGDFAEDVSASLHSAGNLQIGNAGNANLNLHNSGDIWAEKINETLTARVTGGGALGVASLKGPRGDIRSEGTGDIWIKNADLDRLTTFVSGSGGLRFEGRAEIVDAEFAYGGSDIFVAQAGEVNTYRNDNATGEVLVGR